MSDKKHEIDIASLESVSGGVNRNVQFRAVTKAQAKDYQEHGSTVVSIPCAGEYGMDNGQTLKFTKPGLYLLY